MPSIPRVQYRRNELTDLHRQQLVDGPDREGQFFGRAVVRCRVRYPDFDFHPSSMGFCEAAWLALRTELLATVDDEQSLWAFRKFG